MNEQVEMEFDPDSKAVVRMSGEWFELSTETLARFSHWLARQMRSQRYKSIFYNPKGETWGSFPPIFSKRVRVLTYESDYRHALGFQDAETGVFVAVVDATADHGTTLKVGLRWTPQADEFAQYFRAKLELDYGEQMVGGSKGNDTPQVDPMPIIPDRAQLADYFLFFDWVSRQPTARFWKLEDLAKMQTKSLSSIEKAHAIYTQDMDSKRNA